MKAVWAGATLLGLSLIVPSRTSHVHFVQLTTPLSISAEKSHPPYIAFMEAERNRGPSEWDALDRADASVLSTVDAGAPRAESLSEEVVRLADDEVMRLQEMTVAKPVAGTMMADASDNSWIDQLPPRERVLVSEAQARSDILNQDWSMPANDDAQKARDWLLAKAREAIPTDAEAKGIVVGAGTNADGTVSVPDRRGQVVETPALVALENGHLEISGSFQLQGVALLDGHFEVSHREEGIDQEQGSINLREHSYAIKLQGRRGDVVVRMLDKQNRTLGESSFRLADMPLKEGKVRGPLVTLTDPGDLGGQLVSAYKATGNQRFANVTATAISGAIPVTVARNGEFEFNNFQKGSFTIMSASANKHERTLTMVPAGFRAEMPLFPESMIASLKQIVSDQRKMSLDPEAPIVWGRTLLNGKPIAGVRVEVESENGLEPVYFNQAMIPDPTLKSTSENGLYAFIGVAEGFHALIARRGDAYFAHVNVVTEEGAVSVGDLSSRIETDQAVFRVYDAFTGTPQPAALTHQGIEDEAHVDATGTMRALLPRQRRLSLVDVTPELPYSAARYITDDGAGYAHFPLVRADWLTHVRVTLKIDDQPGGSTVVGFVPDEGFTAAPIDPTGKSRVVYFDAQGVPSKENHGTAGGGFIIFGLGEGVREVTVLGETSGLVSTRVMPSDPGALSVLLFRPE